MKLLCLVATALFALLPTASAQIAVYAGFSGAHLSPASDSYTTIYGPLVGVYAQSGHFLAIGGDVRGSFLSKDNIQYYTGAAGPRIAFKHLILPIKPYAEALIGVASYNSGTSSNTTHLNYQLLGGVDATIFPHIDWRVIEFNYSALVNDSVNAKTLTTGLVLRLW